MERHEHPTDHRVSRDRKIRLPRHSPLPQGAGRPGSRFTLCTGAQGDMDLRALSSMAAAASHDTAGASVSFVEEYPAFRAEVDESAEKTGAAKASAFAAVYEQILARPEIRAAQGRADTAEDITERKWEKKVEAWRIPGSLQCTECSTPGPCNAKSWINYRLVGYIMCRCSFRSSRVLASRSR